jgi:hypothetical protein
LQEALEALALKNLFCAAERLAEAKLPAAPAWITASVRPGQAWPMAAQAAD